MQTDANSNQLLTDENGLSISPELSNCAQIFLRGRSIGRTTSRKGWSEAAYHFENHWFNPKSALADRVKLCRDPAGIAKANGLAQAIKENDARSGVQRAVYVVGIEGERVAKIGVSATPVNRCLSLQQAHYKELFLYGALYLVGKPKCETIEEEALIRAEQIADWRKGEWVGLPAERAFSMVMHAADDLEIKTCDAATWVDNMNRRVKGLAKAR